MLVSYKESPLLGWPRLIVPQEEMAMFGYPMEWLNMSTMTESQAWRLAGNGVCATAVCACAMSCMVKLGFLS